MEHGFDRRTCLGPSGSGAESSTVLDVAEHERDRQEHEALLLAMLDEWRESTHRSRFRKRS